MGSEVLDAKRMILGQVEGQSKRFSESSESISTPNSELKMSHFPSYHYLPNADAQFLNKVIVEKFHQTNRPI